MELSMRVWQMMLVPIPYKLLDSLEILTTTLWSGLQRQSNAETA
jgi:hypothetical protein